MISQYKNIFKKNALYMIFSAISAMPTVSMAMVDAQVSVCFTPGQACTHHIVNAIEHAQKTIELQAYSFTSWPIAKALVNAQRRGVDVEAIIDKSQFKCGQYSNVWYLVRHGIPVWDDSEVNIAHNKVMVFDHEVVETGSFNYTMSAQRYNAENVIFIHSPAVAHQYEENWAKRKKFSTKISGTQCFSVG